MPTPPLLLTLATAATGGAGNGDWISKLIDSQAFAAVAGLAVAVLGYLYLRHLGKKKPRPASRAQVGAGGDPLADRGRRQSLAQERAAERDMQGVAVEFAERVREMTGQIDTRLAKLEVLINEADAKIAELRVLRGDAAEPREIGGEIGGEIGHEPESGGNLELPPSGKGLGPLDRHQDVYELADAGHDHDEIARQLGRPRGEVDLILALRP